MANEMLTNAERLAIFRQELAAFDRAREAARDHDDLGAEVTCDECGREYYEPQPTYGGLPNVCPDCYRCCSHSPAYR